METIRYSPIGKEDINFGTGTFEVTLADGRIVLLTQVDVGALLNAGLATTSLSGLTLVSPTITGTITFSSTPTFPTLTANSMTYVNGSNILTSTAAPTNGQLLIGSTGSVPVLASLVAGANVGITNGAGSITISSAPRSALAGYKMSTAGSSTTMTIGAGAATDSTNAKSIASSSSIAKTTALWVVGTGNGGLDTGSIQASTWYYFYAILRTDTGVVDVLFSTNATTPTLPSNYTYYRRIGCGRTDGSSNWIAFTQVGRDFGWSATVLDLNAQTISDTNAHLVTLTIPPIAGMTAVFNVAVNFNTGTNANVYISSPALNNDEAASSTGAAPLGNLQAANVGTAVFQNYYRLMANASGQVRYRSTASGADTISFATLGWVDYAGLYD